MIALALVACRAPEAPAAPTLTVLAASSLTEAMGEVARAWSAEGHGEVKTSFDGSSRLARQIESGAPADLFFSADSAWVDTLEKEGRVHRRRELFGNTLVLVVPTDADWAPRSPAELDDPRLSRLALAGEAVPAGRYAREALRAAGAWTALEPKVAVGDDVRAALAWVALGEAEAGVVYATDARVEPRVKVAFAFDPSTHAAIVYPGAVLTSSTHPEEASAFLDYCASAPAFAAAGFILLGAPR